MSAFNFLHEQQLIDHILPCSSAGATQSNKHRLNMGRVRRESHSVGSSSPTGSLIQGLCVAGWHELLYLGLKDKDLTTKENTKKKMLKLKRQY